MLKRLKNILPVSKRYISTQYHKIEKNLIGFDKRVIKVQKCLDTNIKHLNNEINDIKCNIEDINTKFNDVEQKNSTAYDKTNTNLQEFTNQLKNFENMIDSRFDSINSELATQKQLIRDGHKKTDKTIRTSDEILWGQIFNNTIVDSEWLNKRMFSPGRWAVGYPYLYVLYRILNEIKPQHILELGLGQTTRMISQYAGWQKADHYVVEHDTRWISFFENDFSLSDRTKIVNLELTERSFLDDPQVVSYKNFKESFENKKFNLISIDAPFGYAAEIYARVDIIDLLPECLGESFVILIDDYNRAGEKQTVEVIKKTFDARNIAYCTGIYRGQKNTYMFTSEDLNFLCSM